MIPSYFICDVTQPCKLLLITMPHSYCPVFFH